MSDKREYKIYSDSTCDLPKEYTESLGTEIFKLSFELNGRSYMDGDMPYKDFYNKMREGGSTKTAQIPPDVY